MMSRFLIQCAAATSAIGCLLAGIASAQPGGPGNGCFIYGEHATTNCINGGCDTFEICPTYQGCVRAPNNQGTNVGDAYVIQAVYCTMYRGTGTCPNCIAYATIIGSGNFNNIPTQNCNLPCP